MEAQVLIAVSTDQLEQGLLRDEAAIAVLRADQLERIAELDRRQVATGDGCRTMVEWVTSRLDVAPESAATMVDTARRIADKPKLAAALATGDISFDRATAAARSDGDDPLWHLDVPGIRRHARRHRRYTATEERERFSERFLMVQPSLACDGGRLYGELFGLAFHTVDKALTERADEFAVLPDGTRLPRRQRMADALAAMAEDSLERTIDHETSSSGPQVTLLVDATEPQRGIIAEVEYGPRVGPAALETALCTGSVMVVGIADGRPVVTSDSTRAIPPAVRRYVAWRDGGCCADGCTSRYRLQPHHVRLRAQRGDHDPENLRTLCWFHHHVVVHGHGFRIDPESPVGRTRFLPPTTGRDPP
jgi:Domain of unknown function (DUF222)